jgi:hypothetical protein
MATIANALPSALIILFPIKVQERNGNNNGVKNSVAGFIMGPLQKTVTYQH